MSIQEFIDDAFALRDEWNTAIDELEAAVTAIRDLTEKAESMDPGFDPSDLEEAIGVLKEINDYSGSASDLENATPATI